jgi:hypothetical protein
MWTRSDKKGSKPSLRVYVPDRLIKWWCTFFHEPEEFQAADRDESVQLIKALVDQRVSQNPNGALSDFPMHQRVNGTPKRWHQQPGVIMPYWKSKTRRSPS